MITPGNGAEAARARPPEAPVDAAAGLAARRELFTQIDRWNQIQPPATTPMGRIVLGAGVERPTSELYMRMAKPEMTPPGGVV